MREVNRGRGTGHRVGLGDPDDGGTPGSRGMVRSEWGQIVSAYGSPETAGNIRASLQELREAADLARANAPTRLRYACWSIALAAGQPIGEIERITLPQMPYFMEFLATRKVPDGIG